MKILHQSITIKETSGQKTIAKAGDVFNYIDSDFKKWKTDKAEGETLSQELAVCEMTQDGTFAQIFTKPEEMALTQEQIIEFCKTHKDKLHPDWYTFFLFKVESKFFVAGVDVDPDGLDVYVLEFSCGRVWRAERGDRFVIPQLVLGNSESSDPQTLSPSVPLQKIYTKYRDEETGITAKISEKTVTIKTQRGRFDFQFRNSDKETVRKVAEALLRIINCTN